VCGRIIFLDIYIYNIIYIYFKGRSEPRVAMSYLGENRSAPLLFSYGNKSVSVPQPNLTT
jgi:hypothetical protein